METRDVRLTSDQLLAAAYACSLRRRELKRRLERTSYDGKPGMKSAVMKELAELEELERVFHHNVDQLRRAKAERIRGALGLGEVV